MPTATANRGTDNQTDTAPAPLSADVVARMQADLETASEELSSLLRKFQTGGFTPAELAQAFQRKDTLEKQIARLRREIPEAATANVAAVADAIKQYCLSNPDVVSYFLQGGKNITVAGDNGSIMVGTAAPRKRESSGKPRAERTKTVKAFYRGKPVYKLSTLTASFPRQNGESEQEWKNRLTADYEIQWP